MSIVSVTDSTLPEMWSKIAYDQDSYVISASHCDKVLTVLFTGVSQALATMKNKDYPVAYIIEDKNNEFIAAGIVEWIPEEAEEGMPGHWNYVWTFDKADVPSNARVNSITNSLTWTFFRGVGGKKFGMAFEANSEGTLMSRLMSCVSQWLDDNASETEEVGISLDGVFQARVGVEDGEKVKAIEVVGETKAIIKCDAGNEV